MIGTSSLLELAGLLKGAEGLLQVFLLQLFIALKNMELFSHFSYINWMITSTSCYLEFFMGQMLKTEIQILHIKMFCIIKSLSSWDRDG